MTSPGISQEKGDLLTLSIVKTLALTGLLVGEESRTGQSLADFFGGGYEIVSIVDEKFWSMDGITYMFWSYSEHVRRTKPNMIALMPFIVKTCYLDDYLVARRLWWRSDLFPVDITDGTVFDHPPNDLLLVIPPIVMRQSVNPPTRVGLPDLNSEWICHYVFLDTRVVVVAAFDPERKFVNFSNERIGFDENMTQAFFSYVRSFVKG